MVSFKHKVRVKLTLIQALRLCTGRTAHRGSRDIAPPIHDHCTRRGGEGSASRPSRSLPPGKTRYPLYRRLSGPQGRSGQVRKISSPPGFDARTVRPVATRYTDYANRSTFQTQRSSKFTNVYPALSLPNVSVCLRFCMHQLMCIFYSPPPPSLTP